MTFSEYVDNNFDFLVEKTSDLLPLLNSLLAKRIISSAQREDIDEEARTSSKKATMLWNMLKRKDDEDVPVIIDCLKKTTCAKSLVDRLALYKPQGETPTTLTSSTFESVYPDGDFVVEDAQVPTIAKYLNQFLNATTWEQIKTSWLSQEIRNVVLPGQILKMDIQNSIASWVTKTAKSDRLYSKIVEAVREDSNTAADKLEDVREEVKAKK